VFRSRHAPEDPGAVHRPLLHEFAVYLARRYECSQLIEVSSAEPPVTRPDKLPVLAVRPRRFVASRIPVPDDVRQSVVVCADCHSGMAGALETTRRLVEYAPVAVLTTAQPRPEPGEAADDAQVRGFARFRRRMEKAGLQVLFLGLTLSRDLQKRSMLAIAAKPRPAPIVPASFRAVALVACYNEEDIIVPFLEHTIRQGLEVHLLDNWSTDRTAERAARFLQRGLRTIEKFPQAGPSPGLELYEILRRKEELARQIPGDWFIHLDADELRESPWPNVTIREALYRADSEGFNAVDHTGIVFPPTGGEYHEDLPLPPQFPWFEFGEHSTYALQIKAWKRQPERVQCALRGGHDVHFPGRRVYPFKFLLRHYPVRSQAHGEKKVFGERLPRYSADGRRRGWHVQYDGLARNHSFVRDPSTLSFFDPNTFYEEFLVERLGSVGLAIEDPETVLSASRGNRQ